MVYVKFFLFLFFNFNLIHGMQERILKDYSDRNPCQKIFNNYVHTNKLYKVFSKNRMYNYFVKKQEAISNDFSLSQENKLINLNNNLNKFMNFQYGEKFVKKKAEIDELINNYKNSCDKMFTIKTKDNQEYIVKRIKGIETKSKKPENLADQYAKNLVSRKVNSENARFIIRVNNLNLIKVPKKNILTYDYGNFSIAKKIKMVGNIAKIFKNEGIDNSHKPHILDGNYMDQLIKFEGLTGFNDWKRNDISEVAKENMFLGEDRKLYFIDSDELAYSPNLFGGKKLLEKMQYYFKGGFVGGFFANHEPEESDKEWLTYGLTKEAEKKLNIAVENESNIKKNPIMFYLSILIPKSSHYRIFDLFFKNYFPQNK